MKRDATTFSQIDISHNRTNGLGGGRFVPTSHVQELSFNVMPDSPVTEELRIVHYLLGESFAEAHFDREYRSSMFKSPSHLIFLSVLVQWQRLIYIHACEKLGRDPFEEGVEHFKVWPTKIEIKLPDLVREEDALVQRADFRDLKDYGHGRYKVWTNTRVGCIQMSGQAILFDGSVAPE